MAETSPTASWRARRACRRAARPPRLVLQFAVYTAVALALVAVVLYWFARREATFRAERAVATHASFVADTTLRSSLEARDFTAPATGARLRELERLFGREILAHGGLRAKLYSPQGTVVFSTATELIGHRGDEPEEIEEVARGTPHQGLTTLNHEGGPGIDRRVVEALVPVRLAGGRVVGVFELYQDYGPVAADIRAAMVPIGVALGFALLALYAVLFPILLRASRRLRREAALNEHRARHDALTGLPNRMLLSEAAERALADADRDGGCVALLLMDLDRFKEVNDTLGHQCGDDLLTKVADRLRSVVRTSDTVVRLGGDEFAMLLPGVATTAVAGMIAESVHHALELPFEVNGTSLAVEGSIGIACYPKDGGNLHDLVQHADVAMYAGKRAHSRIVFYEPAMAEGNRATLTLAGDLRRAISADELTVHYQPKGDLRTGMVVGVEALVRWQHPRFGLIGPDEFIPVAERSNLIKHVTGCVLAEALEQTRRWREDGIRLCMSINMSAQDLIDVDLPQRIARALATARVPAECLEIEVTEGSVMGDAVRASDVLCRISSMGVRIAIDDFGTGYSSLRYLRELPVNVLKIDRSFVMGMTESTPDLTIVRSTIELAHNLGLEVVAEGVETPEVEAHLQDLGCDLLQGCHLARPMPAGELRTWLHARDASAPATARVGHLPV